MMEEVVILVDNLYENSYANCCRICHEAEYESCRKLETPCACSGTVKYAHRECIQRWCDEKGDIICEICLQKYEPGYTAIPKQPKRITVRDEGVTIRGSLEIPRREDDVEPSNILVIAECSSSTYTSSSYCKNFALTFTALLLLKCLLEVALGAAHYPFSPATMIILRSCGVIVPMCVIIQTISILQNRIRQHRDTHDVIIGDDNYREEAGDLEQAMQR
ncbi:hypothetical protein RND81_07G011400 [Saponaria officinalis]|uniref:RING-CH-type domain-containing protein n=1 Tax=Saponaria officinalis TaxID=3572 RepID=A0AAW1JJU0_SAPOF